MAEIDIGPDDPKRSDVWSMLTLSDKYLQALYPPESNHLVDENALAAPEAVLLAARRNGYLLGIIAFRVISPGHAEMKRMFVHPEARGAGLGRRLLHALETEARERNIGQVSLETGIKQPEAIGLYRTSGYQECPPFGTYKPDPLSLFMTKSLNPN